MNISELSYISDNTNLVKKHDVLLQLQERGHKVDAIYNKHLNRYDENLIGVDDLLCYMLPMDNTPRILSNAVLTDTDFIIASFKIASTVSYYIIPSDEVLENKGSYPLEYGFYKDRWDLLSL